VAVAAAAVVAADTVAVEADAGAIS
jgi:hypothetical protein